MADDSQKPETVDFSSSAIQSATYDPADGSMRIVFTSGREYPYRGVAADFWSDFKSAVSPGRFYHDFIKGKFE